MVNEQLDDTQKEADEKFSDSSKLKYKPIASAVDLIGPQLYAQ